MYHRQQNRDDDRRRKQRDHRLQHENFNLSNNDDSSRKMAKYDHRISDDTRKEQSEAKYRQPQAKYKQKQAKYHRRHQEILQICNDDDKRQQEKYNIQHEIRKNYDRAEQLQKLAWVQERGELERETQIEKEKFSALATRRQMLSEFEKQVQSMYVQSCESQEETKKLTARKEEEERASTKYIENNQKRVPVPFDWATHLLDENYNNPAQQKKKSE